MLLTRLQLLPLRLALLPPELLRPPLRLLVMLLLLLLLLLVLARLTIRGVCGAAAGTLDDLPPPS